MKGKKKKSRGSKVSELKSDGLSDEELMAFVDGELQDLDTKKRIEELPNLQERIAPFVSTRELLKTLGAATLNEPPPQSVIDLVREGIEAQEQGRSLLRELEIMAAVDGEPGFGGEEVSASEIQSETAQMFSRTGVLLRRMGAAILQEPVPKHIEHLIEEGLKKKDVQTAQPPAFDIQKLVRDFFNRIVSFGRLRSAQGLASPACDAGLIPLRIDYRFVGVAATAILAVALFNFSSLKSPPFIPVVESGSQAQDNVPLPLPLGPIQAVEQVNVSVLESWEERFARLELDLDFTIESWLSNGDGIFATFSLLRSPAGLVMRGIEQATVPVVTDSPSISELEEILDQMVENQNTRGLLELPNDEQTQILLRALTVPPVPSPVAVTIGSASNPPCAPGATCLEEPCIIGELVDGETTDLELTLISQFFSFCPASTDSRLTFLE